MESRNTTRGNSLKDVEEVLKEIPINYLALHKRASARKIVPTKIRGRNYYTPWQVEALKLNKERKDYSFRYYPLKTTETFYIYESKINYDYY